MKGQQCNNCSSTQFPRSALAAVDSSPLLTLDRSGCPAVELICEMGLTSLALVVRTRCSSTWVRQLVHLPLSKVNVRQQIDSCSLVAATSSRQSHTVDRLVETSLLLRRRRRSRKSSCDRAIKTSCRSVKKTQRVFH